MHSAYLAIYLSSLLLISGCSTPRYFMALSDNRGLPRLQDQQSLTIIQVAINFNPDIKRDHPYFIVCGESDCPTPTTKTLLTQKKAKQSSLKNVSRNDSYLKKTATVLEQFGVNFDYASADLTDRFQSLLQSFVDDYPHQHKKIRVTGYTDSGSKPDGTIGNEWLALERAISVKKQLINSGYPETQIFLEAKFLCCYIDSNKSETGRYNNRRAELSLIHVLQH